MKLNGNTSKRSAAARREAADFAAQERSAHRSTANRSTQSRAAAPKQAAAQRPPVPRQEQPARRGAKGAIPPDDRFEFFLRLDIITGEGVVGLLRLLPRKQ